MPEEGLEIDRSNPVGAWEQALLDGLIPPGTTFEMFKAGATPGKSSIGRPSDFEIMDKTARRSGVQVKDIVKRRTF